MTEGNSQTDGVLVKAARAVGSAVGAIAVVGKATVQTQTTKARGDGRFVLRGKSRLPRKQKKALRKSEAKRARERQGK